MAEKIKKSDLQAKYACKSTATPLTPSGVKGAQKNAYHTRNDFSSNLNRLKMTMLNPNRGISPPPYQPMDYLQTRSSHRLTLE